jgi:uncharacterized protein (DUF2062 family)
MLTAVRRARQWLRTLMSLHGSPAGIAGGFTLGLGLSLVPIPFAGMLVALALAPLLRLNLPATYLGTAVTNPLTGPFIYFAELWMGAAVLRSPLPTFESLRALDTAGWWALFGELLGPAALGTTILVAASVLTVFPLLYTLSKRWQARRASAHGSR